MDSYRCSTISVLVRSAELLHRAKVTPWLHDAKEHALNFSELDLSPTLLNAVKAAGYSEPTPIQEQTIPLALQGRDVLGMAQTGTGKTASFLLPILEKLNNRKPGRIRALILSPTRELTEQIHRNANELKGSTHVKSVAIYGGVGKGPQIRALRGRAEIAVACPGRLLDLLTTENIDLSSVEMLVLDEADTMCDMGFLPEVKKILRYLPAERQTFFFAATMPDEIRKLSAEMLKDPATVEIGMAAPAKTVTHALYPSSENLKKSMLDEILKQTATGRVLIFTRTKHRAKRLADQLLDSQYRVVALQGNMSQNKREQALHGFRTGKFDMLVATDVASRGIDVSDITHVINFDMPNTVDAYIHRVGRTGRAGNVGEAFTLATSDDIGMIKRIQSVLGSTIPQRQISGFDYGTFNPVLGGSGQNGSSRSLPRSNRPNSQTPTDRGNQPVRRFRKPWNQRQAARFSKLSPTG